jgi:hypothetical protein
MNVQLHTPFPATVSLEQLPFFSERTEVLKPFDERTLGFLDTVSKTIFANAGIARIPEITALAFWLRRANMEQIKAENAYLFQQQLYITAPLGRVFHVCPANVDTMFLYSMAIALLMGNRNLLRISSRMEAPQITALFQTLNKVMEREEYAPFQQYINLISYGHEADINHYIAANCQGRIIWGGDQTIETFRQFKTSPRTRDIMFADRVSATCIGCETYNQLDEAARNRFVTQLYNDSYTFDQKGCSSPQTVFLMGDEQQYRLCMESITDLLATFAGSRYEADIASLASLKFNQAVDDVVDGKIAARQGNNVATFVSWNPMNNELQHSCGGGYFYTRRINTVAELKPFINIKLQTLSYFGLPQDEMDGLKELCRAEGVDRIVPVGNALDFHYIWDGYNLLEQLSRKVYLK